MTSVALTQSFLANARGVTFADGGGATWSFNPNTNTLSLSVSGTGIVPGSVVNSDLANMNANTIKGNNTGSPAAPSDLTVAQVKTLLSLNLVENTALSTWGGSTNITLLGTITSGVWTGTAIASGNIAAVLTGKTYNGLTLTGQTVGFTIAGGTTPETLTVGANASVSGTNTGDQALPVGANPATAKVGLTAVNGAAVSFMRSDAAPPLDVSIAPTWTGAHTWSVQLNVNAGALFANGQGLAWKDSGGTTRTVLQLFSDNNVYFDNATAAGDINIRVAGGGTTAINIKGSNGAVTFNNNVGFYGTTPVAKPTITGAKGGNVALANLLTALASYGLLIDSTT